MERKDTFYIPKNYNDPGTLLGHTYRNWAEALVVAFVLFRLINATPFILTIRIPAIVIICGLMFALFLVGIKGESVTQFLISSVKFYKKRRVLHLRRSGYIPKRERKGMDDVSEAFSEQERKEDTYEFSQDWIPVESIEYGIVKLKDGAHVMILEVEPIPFLLRSVDERLDIVAQLAAWLHIAPAEIQWRETTVKTDTSNLISSIKKATEHETDPMILKRRAELLHHVKTMTSSQTISKRFFLIYRYEGSEYDAAVSSSEEEIRQTMYHTRAMADTFFSKMGSRIISHEDETYFTAEILYQELNPKSSLKEKLSDRIHRISTDAAAAAFLRGEEEVEEDVPSFLSPRGLDFTNSGYTVIDGMFRTHLFVRSDGYRDTVTTGWFDIFTQFGTGVTVDMYSIKSDKDRSIFWAGYIQNLRSSQARDRNRGEASAVEKRSDAQVAKYIRDMMRDYDEDLYDMFIMLTITAESLADLKKKKNYIKRILRSKSYRLDDCLMHPEEALKMSLPLLCINQGIFKRGRRNILTSSLASTYMYTAFEITDPEGVPIGINTTNATLAAPNLFNSRRYANANAIVLGSSGRGKSFFLMLLAYTMRLTGRKVFLILGDKGHEWMKMTRNIGGTYVELSPGSKSCINIMAIRPKAELDLDMVEDYSDEIECLLSKKIHQLITFVQLNMKHGEMSDVEESQLSILLSSLYQSFGITEDNESIWLDKEKKIIKTMPTLGDFYEATCKNSVLSRRISQILDTYVHGDGRNMNGQTNVDLENNFVAISVSNAGKRMIAPFFFIAVDCCYDEIKQDRTENEVLIMDEVWKMMTNHNASEYVMEIYKIVRGYGGSAISATQDLDDLRASEHGYGIINNAKVKFLFGVEKQEARALGDIANLSENDRRLIVGLSRGQCLMSSNNDNIPVNILAPKEWETFFTTDAKRLRELKSKE